VKSQNVVDEYDYSDEAERKIIRAQLYADLKWHGGPFAYAADYPKPRPNDVDAKDEPSIDLWRRGYLVLKAKERQQRTWLLFGAAVGVLCGALWLLQRAGLI
jgi:hypothetical protein